MAFEFLTTLDTTSLLLLLIIFILFVLSMKKAFTIVINTVWAAGLSLLFPIVMNRFFGFDIPVDMNSLISFMMIGVGLYFIYVLGSSIYKILGTAEKLFAKVPKPSISLPKGEHQKDSRSDLKLREKELKLKEKELRLKEKEDRAKEAHGRWMAQVETSKKSSVNRKDDYVELEDKPERKNFAEPVKEIKHKKKKDED
jgi:hypothetical protein